MSEAKELQPVTRDYTVHLHKHIHGVGFKKRAPRAVKVIKQFAAKAMKTNDVRISQELNKAVWSRGVRNVPYRIRVRIQRLRSKEEDAQEPFYAAVDFVPVTTFKGLQTVKVENADEE